MVNMTPYDIIHHTTPNYPKYSSEILDPCKRLCQKHSFSHGPVSFESSLLLGSEVGGRGEEVGKLKSVGTGSSSCRTLYFGFRDTSMK